MNARRRTAAAPGGSREATENALLDALETVLLRDGLRRLTVNAVVEAAGVAKPLLYRYFGDLPGLVRAWGERRRFWLAAGPGVQEAAAAGLAPGAGEQPADDGEFRQRISAELVANADYLREHPVTVEFLAEELTAQSELSAAFAAARDRQRRPFLRAMLKDSRYLRRDHRRAIIILNAAATYLAMRSRRSPNFMGLRLDTAEGWEEAMAMIRELAALPDPAAGGDGPAPDETTAPATRARRKTPSARSAGRKKPKE